MQGSALHDLFFIQRYFHSIFSLQGSALHDLFFNQRYFHSVFSLQGSALHLLSSRLRLGDLFFGRGPAQSYEARRASPEPSPTWAPFRRRPADVFRLRRCEAGPFGGRRHLPRFARMPDAFPLSAEFGRSPEGIRPKPCPPREPNPGPANMVPSKKVAVICQDD